MNLASAPAQTTTTTATEAVTNFAAASVKDDDSSTLPRDLLIESIRKRVMAWTKWNWVDGVEERSSS